LNVEKAFKAVKAAVIAVSALAAALSLAATVRVDHRYALGVLIWILIGLAASKA